MKLDPSTPVLVGAGVASRRCQDPLKALESIELMVEAVANAGRDAGCPGLLERVDRIGVPRGFWAYSDPGRLIADRFGSVRATTVMAEIGVLQQALLSDACRAIAEGEAGVAVVAGGDAKYRSLRAGIVGATISDTEQVGVAPDIRWQPKESLWAELEWERGLHMPVDYFSVIENALRHDQGIGIDAHRKELGRMYAEFSRVAAENPDAWNRRIVEAEQIATPSDANPMLAFPYTKLHNTSWNVDQAAGLVLCSVQIAQELGIPSDRWVFPLSATESNFMLSLSRREALHRSPGAAIAGLRAMALAGRGPDDFDCADFYSCFPAAVRIMALELGFSLDRPLTVTGGMPFAGGPLNNYVLQATARMAQVLREGAGGSGIVTSLSGMLTKQGFAVWSREEPTGSFGFEDVTAQVAEATTALELVEDAAGPATVAGYTVLYADGAPARGIAVCDLEDHRRTVAYTEDTALATHMTEVEFCGRRVAIDGDGVLCPV